MASDLDRLRAMVEAMRPGPWTVEPPEPLMDAAIRAPDTVLEIATVPHAHGYTTIDECRANALGIATLRDVAPELLAVAEAAERVRESAEPDPVGEPMYAGEALDALSAALDALRAKLREVAR